MARSLSTAMARREKAASSDTCWMCSRVGASSAFSSSGVGATDGGRLGVPRELCGRELAAHRRRAQRHRAARRGIVAETGEGFVVPAQRDREPAARLRIEFASHLCPSCVERRWQCGGQRVQRMHDRAARQRPVHDDQVEPGLVGQQRERVAARGAGHPGHGGVGPGGRRDRHEQAGTDGGSETPACRGGSKGRSILQGHVVHAQSRAARGVNA